MDNLLCCDMVFLLVLGYLVMVWEIDNFGVWFMYCYIGWYIFEGFVLQFIERYSEIVGILDEDWMNEICFIWLVF